MKAPWKPFEAASSRAAVATTVLVAGSFAFLFLGVGLDDDLLARGLGGDDDLSMAAHRDRSRRPGTTLSDLGADLLGLERETKVEGPVSEAVSLLIDELVLIAERGGSTLPPKGRERLAKLADHVEEAGLSTLATSMRELMAGGMDMPASLLRTRFLCQLSLEASTDLLVPKRGRTVLGLGRS